MLKADIGEVTHDSQCAYSVTWGCAGATAVAVEKQCVLPVVNMCVCVGGGANSSSMQYACAMLYYHLWPVWMYHIFPHLINGTIFGEKVAEHKMSCDLLCTEIFLILRRYQRDIIKMYRELHYLFFFFDFNET